VGVLQVKHIGVSNFSVEHLKALIAATGIKPTVNQVEMHPYLPQDDLVEYCKQEGIVLTAYYPIGGQGASCACSICSLY
jgi:L-glyceraldehyde reductase